MISFPRMKSVLRYGGGLLALTSLLVAGCAQPQADSTFTVQQIDSAPRRDGVVRIQLKTSGDLAEADESLLVNYVRIIAVRAASQRQREVADQRARAAFRKMGKLGTTTRKKSRYLAVATERSEATRGRKPAQSVMLWDTHSQSIVGNNVYDVEAAPSLGSTARFETYSAEYVGSGF